MNPTRRDFMRLFALGATATAAGIVVPQPIVSAEQLEPRRRWWQVARNAPVRDGFARFVVAFPVPLPPRATLLGVRAYGSVDGKLVEIPVKLVRDAAGTLFATVDGIGVEDIAHVGVHYWEESEVIDCSVGFARRSA